LNNKERNLPFKAKDQGHWFLGKGSLEGIYKTFPFPLCSSLQGGEHRERPWGVLFGALRGHY